MKFECLNESCKRAFIYPAIMKKPLNKDGNIAVAVGSLVVITDSIETHVCPYCHSLDFKEYVEVEPAITSVISVDIQDVDAKLKEGYEVHSLYQKSATLVKKEEVKKT